MQWLSERGLRPESLRLENPNNVLADWADSRITLERITYLLGRAGALGLAVEKWERAGVWVITPGDADYPTRFKKLLKHGSPPVIHWQCQPEPVERGWSRGGWLT